MTPALTRNELPSLHFLAADDDDAGDWVFELEDDGVSAVRTALDLPAESTADRDAAAVAAMMDALRG